MLGRLAFDGSEDPTTIDGKRIKPIHRSSRIDQGFGSIAHCKREWRRAIKLPNGKRLLPFLTKKEQIEIGYK